MAKSITITEQNPQHATVVVPGFHSRVRFVNSGRTVATFQTMALERQVPISSGEILIIDEGRQGAAGSNLTLAAPQCRGIYETGNDGAVLKIISTVQFKHTIRTPPNVLNGRAATITLDGIGAAVELLANAGRWLVVSASPMGVTIK